MSEGQFYLGVDLGGTTIHAGVVDCQNGTVLTSESVLTQADKGAQIVFDNMKNLLQSMLECFSVKAIGIGTPGMVNESSGSVVGCPNIKGWDEIPFLFLIRDHFSLPVFAENDANMSALGEHCFSCENDSFQHSLSVTLGTGVGGGIILNNRIFTGYGYAGEIGHMVIDKGGRPCACGSQGCFEQYVSCQGIEQSYRHFLDKNSSVEVTAKMIFDQYRQGDPLCIQVVENYCDDLACGIGNLLNIFDIPLIFLSGGVARSADMIIPLVTANLHRYVISFASRKIILKHSNLGDQSGFMGSAVYACQRLEASF